MQPTTGLPSASRALMCASLPTYRWRLDALKRGARVVSPIGKQWTEANIGSALAGRDIARHLRELGEKTRGPAPLTKHDRSRFLRVLDTALRAALREEARSGPGL